MMITMSTDIYFIKEDIGKNFHSTQVFYSFNLITMYLIVINLLI